MTLLCYQPSIDLALLTTNYRHCFVTDLLLTLLCYQAFRVLVLRFEPASLALEPTKLSPRPMRPLRLVLRSPRCLFEPSGLKKAKVMESIMHLNIVHFRDEATRTWLWVQWLSFLLPRPSWSRTYSRGTAKCQPPSILLFNLD